MTASKPDTDIPLRCSACPWEGLRSATARKIILGMARSLCPKCFQPCRATHDKPGKLVVKPVKIVRPQGRPVSEAALTRVRECTRCGFTAPGREFPIACQRGRQTIRSWCRACTLAYYRERLARRKAAKAK